MKKFDVPPLSQREIEHLTYLKVYEKYNEFKEKRLNYRRYGSLFIILSAVVFLALMFSLESKIEFLCLWIVTILYCVAVMIRADYKYNMYKEMLGIADEFDIYEYDEEESTEKPPETAVKSDNQPKSALTSEKGEVNTDNGQHNKNISE